MTKSSGVTTLDYKVASPQKELFQICSWNCANMPGFHQNIAKPSTSISHNINNKDALKPSVFLKHKVLQDTRVHFTDVKLEIDKVTEQQPTPSSLYFGAKVYFQGTIQYIYSLSINYGCFLQRNRKARGIWKVPAGEQMLCQQKRELGIPHFFSKKMDCILESIHYH